MSLGNKIEFKCPECDEDSGKATKMEMLQRVDAQSKLDKTNDSMDTIT